MKIARRCFLTSYAVYTLPQSQTTSHMPTSQCTKTRILTTIYSTRSSARSGRTRKILSYSRNLVPGACCGTPPVLCVSVCCITSPSWVKPPVTPGARFTSNIYGDTMKSCPLDSSSGHFSLRLYLLAATTLPCTSAAIAASAASGTSSFKAASSSEENLANTQSAPSHCSGGLPTPNRTRTVSPVPRCSRMLRNPLCPASPPPCFTWMRPNSRSISSCTTTIPSGGTFQNRAACATASPLTFMYACGSSTAMSCAFPTSAFQRESDPSAAPSFRAASAATRKPTL